MKEAERFLSSVTVGPKGQIVIPKEVRAMFGIEPGSRLILMADAERGIAIQRQDIMNQVADAIFQQNDAGKTPFAHAIKDGASGKKVMK